MPFGVPKAVHTVGPTSPDGLEAHASGASYRPSSPDKTVDTAVSKGYAIVLFFSEK